MKRAIYIVVLLSFVCALRAQTITSYSCDFEDPAEVALWQRNVGPAGANCKNQWRVGTAGSFGINSTQGMYISGGVIPDTLENKYEKNLGNRIPGEYVTSYRQLNLADGQYTLVFDWTALGTSDDALYVAWVAPNEEGRGIISSTSSAQPPSYCTANNRYNGEITWNSVSATINVSGGQGGKLVFVWFTKSGATPAANPAAAIDNICIYQGSCPAPTDVKYDADGASLTWMGSASSYDVIVYNHHTHSTEIHAGLTTNSCPLGALTEEGMYNFYVRSVCDAQKHSPWVFTSKFVWIKGARCIDLFDIGPSRDHAGVCYTGTFNDFIKNGNQGTLDMDDLGPQDPASTHTLHVDGNEIDPNTTVNGGLRVVPDGEIASIRLGAYTPSGKSSRLEYKYTVLPGMSDLFDLKYAVVMESGNHGSSLSDPDMNPTFTLNILDGQGHELDACTQRYFVAGYGDQSNWHNEPQDQNIYWCDWSTVTVSLRRYIGQTITIRLTSTRCSYDTHPAYAYFSFNCRGGDLQGVACNDFSTDHFEAPEGFNYKWYRADDPTKTVLETGQVFNIGRDDPTVYLVDVIDRNSTGCSYTLEANPNPRFPKAKAKMLSSKTANCEQKVDFEQACKVVRINRQTMDSVLTTEDVERIVWDFGDGSPVLDTLGMMVSHSYPAEGGTYNVTVKASMSGGICEDVYTFPITLPDITSPDTHTNIHICAEGTDYADTTVLKNTHGCEYKAIEHHYFHSAYDTTYSDRMCEGGRYLFPGNGKYYTVSIDTAVVLQSQYGCDSTIRLSLVVDPKLEVTYPNSLKVCIEDNAIVIPYEVVSGMLEDVHVYFSERDQERGFQPVYTFSADEPIRIPLPDGVRPDRYTVTLDFSSERCQMAPQTLPVMLTYPSSIVMQTGGFIAVQNADYNGGYEFTSFVWTKDGEPMDNSASYVPASAEDRGSVYVLTLTRQGEDYTVESCPIVYNPSAQGIEDVFAAGARVWPTSVRSGGALWLAPEACAIYSVLGTKVATYPQSDALRSVTAPSQPGVYVVVFDNHQSSSIIVR